MAEEEMASSAATSTMKIVAAITGTELTFIDDLLRPDPVAVVIKVGRVMLLLEYVDGIEELNY